MRRQAFEKEQLDFVEKMKLQKEKESVNAALEKANPALKPKQEVVSSPRGLQKVATPGRIGSSKLTMRKKNAQAII